MRSRAWLVGCTIAAGCPPPHWFDAATDAAPEATTDVGSSGASPLPTTSATGSTGTTGTTAAPPDESSSGQVESTGTTTGELAGPPKVLAVTFVPAPPITALGPVHVQVATLDADAVSMTVDVDPAPIELIEDQSQLFVDETSIAIVSAQANGNHCATFTPWRDGQKGAAEEACFKVEVASGGTQVYWEDAPAKGTGSVAALASLPGGQVAEFGTYYPKGQPRCYLRRRDQGGAWGADDFDDAFVADTCTATDMVATPEGALYLLANVTQNGETRWWLGRLAGWKQSPEQLGFGEAGATGRAVAREATSDRVAVCGTQPTQVVDIDDAAIWIFRPNMPGLTMQFDYMPANVPHEFRETPYDCAFTEGALVLVGEARGSHEENEVKRNRSFLLEFGPGWPEGHFSVAGPNIGLESGATALAIDDDGNYITAGYTCSEPCTKAAELRVFAPGGGTIGDTPLPSNMLAPLDLAYHPAGFVVLASGSQTGPTTVFTAQAWFADANAPVWTYTHKNAPSSELATALAIGPFGQVYAGGISAAGYPAIAYIAP